MDNPITEEVGEGIKTDFNNRDYILTLLLLCKQSKNINSDRMLYCLSTIRDLIDTTPSSHGPVWYTIPCYQWSTKDYAQFLISFLITFYNPSMDYTIKKKSVNNRDNWIEKTTKEKRSFYWESADEMGEVFKYIHNENESLKGYADEIWLECHGNVLFKDIKKNIVTKKGKSVSIKEYDLHWTECNNFTLYQTLNISFLQAREICTEKSNQLNDKTILAQCMATRNPVLLCENLNIHRIFCEMLIIFNSAKLQYVSGQLTEKHTNNNEEDDEEEYIEEYEGEGLVEEKKVINDNNDNEDNDNIVIQDETLPKIEIIEEENNNINNRRTVTVKKQKKRRF